MVALLSINPVEAPPTYLVLSGVFGVVKGLLWLWLCKFSHTYMRHGL